MEMISERMQWFCRDGLYQAGSCMIWAIRVSWGVVVDASDALSRSPYLGHLLPASVSGTHTHTPHPHPRQFTTND